MDTLREQVMINQFVLVAGCNHDQAKQLLSNNNWQFQRALSIFFLESPITGLGQNGRFNPLTTPANTPATPPNFPETLLAFAKFSTSSDVGTNNNNNTNSSVNVNDNNNDITVANNNNNNNTHNHPQYHSHHKGIAASKQHQFNNRHFLHQHINHNSNPSNGNNELQTTTSPTSTFPVDGAGLNSTKGICLTIQR